MSSNTDNKRIVISGDNNKIHIVAQTWFEFMPQKDITVYELAKILEIAGLSMNEDICKQLRDPKVARHFKKVKGNEG